MPNATPSASTIEQKIMALLEDVYHLDDEVVLRKKQQVPFQWLPSPKSVDILIKKYPYARYFRKRLLVIEKSIREAAQQVLKERYTYFVDVNSLQGDDNFFTRHGELYVFYAAACRDPGDKVTPVHWSVWGKHYGNVGEADYYTYNFSKIFLSAPQNKQRMILGMYMTLYGINDTLDCLPFGCALVGFGKTKAEKKLSVQLLKELESDIDRMERNDSTWPFIRHCVQKVVEEFEKRIPLDKRIIARCFSIEQGVL